MATPKASAVTSLATMPSLYPKGNGANQLNPVPCRTASETPDSRTTRGERSKGRDWWTALPEFALVTGGSDSICLRPNNFIDVQRVHVREHPLPTGSVAIRLHSFSKFEASPSRRLTATTLPIPQTAPTFAQYPPDAGDQAVLPQLCRIANSRMLPLARSMRKAVGAAKTSNA